MTRMLMLAMAALLVGTGSAQAAGPGDVILTGGLPLPAGAFAGGASGYGGGEPTRLAVSANGRYVAFASDADALAGDGHPDVTNVVRKDRVTGEVLLVGRATGANGAVPLQWGADVRISDDGGRVAWLTRAALDPADTDDVRDVYVRDIATATTTLATPGTADGVFGYDLSGNGLWVAFDTEDALAGANDANGARDVYRRAVAGGVSTLVSRKTGTPQAATGASSDPAISDDGRWVAFASAATDVVAGFVDGSGARDVYVRDTTSGTPYLVSNQSGAALTGANGSSSAPDVAGAPGAAIAGVYVAYNTDATNVTTAGVDTSGAESVYRRRLSESTSTLVSRATGVGGANADSRAHVGGITDDGARIVFASDAGNLGAGADYYGAYVRDVGAGTTALASADNAYAVQPDISDDGTVIAWVNGSAGITPDGDPDLIGVFARAGGGATELVSRPAAAGPFLAPAVPIQSAGPGARTISADGRYVVFTAYARRLPGNLEGIQQVYRRDLVTGALDLVSRATGADGAPGARGSGEATISADGTRVAFRSFARLDPADVDDLGAAYVRDLAAGTTTLASRAGGPGGAVPDAGVSVPRIAAGGQHVAFVTGATNLGVPGTFEHVYLRNLATGETQLVDRATGADGVIGNGDVGGIAVSGDGRQVAFTSAANTLDPADPAPATAVDVYVRDTVARTTLLASRRSGLDAPKAAGPSRDVAISADGSVVAFETDDDTLAPEAGAWPGGPQVVARRLASGENTLVSRVPGGPAADGSAGDPSVSADGSVVAFETRAANLLPGVGGGSRTILARTMATGALAGPPAFGLVDAEPENYAIAPSISDDGRCLAFQARGHNAFTGAAGDFSTGYVFVRDGNCPIPAAPAPVPSAQPAKASITGASLLRKRFRVGKRPTAKRAGVARKAKAGTAFRFGLTAGADVTITIQRRTAGRRVAGTCRKPTRKLRKRPACARFVKRGALVRRGLAVKRHRVAFSGRVGRAKLAPGRYRAVLVARNAAGASRAVKLPFRVVR